MALEGQPSHQGKPLVAIMIVVLVVGSVGVLAYYAMKPTACSGYPPGGNCIAPYSNTFTISLSYAGPWKLNYTGQTNVGESNPYNMTGTRTGSGNYSVSVTLSGLDSRMLTLCAKAQKLDASNSTLLLSIGAIYPKNASSPYGTVSFCGAVAP